MAEQTITPDPEDAALKAALAGYSAKQIQSALALIAAGRYKPYTSGGHAWTMQSATRKGVSYLVVVDEADALFHPWCNCPIGSRHRPCYHGAAAIMLRIHAEHNPPEPEHRVWCPGRPAGAHVVASSRHEVCCPLDVRTDATAYDPFAVFDRL